MDVDADPRAAGHILVELGLAVARSGDAVVGTAQVVPEMWVPGTTSLRTSILATWVDHVAGLAAIGVLAPRVPVTLELDVHLHGQAPAAGTIHAEARLIKAGRSVVVSGVDITDHDGTPVALGTASFMVAPDPRVELPTDLSLDRLAEPAPRLRRPFAERAGCVRQQP
ncbi:MAG TPA: PaaI family thioesterase, partial [Acidimicrobiales bacterium]|nr:PaaI family thioesterase [Acidimicrobiales bacterium]